MKRLLALLLFWPVMALSAPFIPPRALPLLPVIVKSELQYFTDLPYRAYIPGQIEQETCISLKSSRCWSEKAELKTSREYGFSLGQFTVAYNKDGSVRFNAWEEVKKLHPDLKNWQWADRLNPEMQIKAIVIKNAYNWGRAKFKTASPMQRLYFVAVEYNSGSTKRDRDLCAATPNCDPTRWFGEPGKLGVSDVSVKPRVAAKGYKKSWFEISREYPVNIFFKRAPKYEPYMLTTPQDHP